MQEHSYKLPHSNNHQPTELMDVAMRYFTADDETKQKVREILGMQRATVMRFPASTPRF